MRMSLSFKLFLTVCLLIVFIILSVILLNSTVLEHYYEREKEKVLIDVFNQATAYYENNSINSSSEFVTELQKIDSTQNIEIAIFDLESKLFYTTSNNFLMNGFFMNDITGSLSEDTPYTIKTFSDKKLKTDFATLYGKTANDYIIILRTPIESIRESVKISNRFLTLVGLVCVVISSIISYFVSKAFSNPVMELNDIAQKMSNLDFSKKYNVTTNDEIGTLGTSINKLSGNLEKTIQDLKEANIELEKDVEETSKISEMRNQFISDVSHELKTPIALIQGYAEGLKDGVAQDEESRNYYIDVILDEANKMGNLTRDLLDLSRLEYGKEELHIEDFNITELAKNTLKKNELLLQEKNIKCEFESKEDYFVKADSSRIEQVLTNYISNALKNVCNENIIKCTIQDLENNKIKVSIFNSGNPIPDEELPRLWTRFYKADTSRNREAGGTGIGLSLVKAIMNQHHQECGARNLENGVEFWFEVEKA